MWLFSVTFWWLARAIYVVDGRILVTFWKGGGAHMSRGLKDILNIYIIYLVSARHWRSHYSRVQDWLMRRRYVLFINIYRPRRSTREGDVYTWECLSVYLGLKEGGSYLGQGGTYLDREYLPWTGGDAYLRQGYLPWMGGTYLGLGGYLSWRYSPPLGWIWQPPPSCKKEQYSSTVCLLHSRRRTFLFLRGIG